MKKIILTIGVLLMLGIGMTIAIPVKAPQIRDFYIPNSPIDSQVFITFSEQMDQRSVEESFEMSGTDRVPVEGKISWAGKTFVFTPDEPLEYDSQYQVTVADGATSSRGQKLQEEWIHSYNTHEHGFYFIGAQDEKEGVLMKYAIASRDASQVTDSDLFIQSYDYDPYAENIVALVAERSEARKDDIVFYPYTLDLRKDNPKFRPIKAFHTGKKFLYHHLQWIPFENSILLARTEVEEYDRVPILSDDPSKTELVKYDFDKKEYEVIRRGLSFFYPVSLTPDGRQFMYINEHGALAIYNMTTGDEQLVASQFLEQYGFSTYGGYLMYTVADSDDIVNLSNHLVLQPTEGENLHVFRETSAIVDKPTISPDEGSIAFKYHVEYGPPLYNAKFELGLLDLSAASEEDQSVLDDIKILTNPEDGSIDAPQFSPDGKYLSFHQYDLLLSYIDRRVMWDGYNRKHIGAPIILYNLSKLKKTETNQVGLDIQWIQ